MRRFILSLCLSVIGFALAIAPVLADSIGPTPK